MNMHLNDQPAEEIMRRFKIAALGLSIAILAGGAVSPLSWFRLAEAGAFAAGLWFAVVNIASWMRISKAFLQREGGKKNVLLALVFKLGALLLIIACVTALNWSYVLWAFLGYLAEMSAGAAAMTGGQKAEQGRDAGPG